MIDHRIAMMGRSPNILGEMARGTQLAGMANEVNRTNQLQNIFREQGPGIMSGDPTALNALASFDPMMATNIQTTQAENRRADTRLGMAQEELQMLRERTARAIAEAEDKQQAEAEARSAIQMAIQAEAALTAGDTATWSQISREFTGGQPLEPTPDNMRRILAIAQGGQEALAGLQSMYAQPEIPSGAQTLEWRAKQAGLVPGTPEYQAFMANGGKPPEGMRFSVNADGTTTFEQGAGVTGGMSKPFTEGQSKDNVYATRAEGALALLDSVGAEALTSRGDRALDIAPFGLTRGLQSENFQVAQQAGEEFLQAILRKDTGAAITAQEQDLYGKTYLPQPGDGPAVLEAKRQSRIRAIEALKAGMSIQQVTVTERALVQAAERAGAAPVSGAPATVAPPQQAVDMLRNDPSMEAMREFDEVFGEGAAAKALRR